MKFIMFLLMMACSSASIADEQGLLDKAKNLLGIETEDEKLVLVDDLSADDVFNRLAERISLSHFKTSLRHSGTVDVTLRPVVSEFAINSLDVSRLTITLFVDVEGFDVDYSEKMQFITDIKPYFDYTTDRVGFYPVGRPSLTSVNDNSFTRQELEISMYDAVSNALTSSIKSSGIPNLTADEIALIEPRIDDVAFRVDGHHYEIIVNKN